MDITFFKKLGFSDKISSVYTTLLRLGPSSVRRLAEEAGLNRGSTYDALKWLQKEGLVNFYHQNTKQYFVAENPQKLQLLVERRSHEWQQMGEQLKRLIPELRSLYDRGGERPVARYYEGSLGLRSILQEVLDTVEQSSEKVYSIYSAIRLREYLYEGFKNFSEERIRRGIHVKVIAMGEGGQLRGLDERKWLATPDDFQTYTLMYCGKTAYVSLDLSGQPIGVVIDNERVFQTQKIIFHSLWNRL